MSRITTTGLARMKERHEKIVMVTAYDYPSACLVEEANGKAAVLDDAPPGQVPHSFEQSADAAKAPAGYSGCGRWGMTSSK